MPPSKYPPERRFWPKVEKTSGCWIWKASRDKYGYGQFTFRGECESAHRVAWILCNGPIPEGLGVLHKCDNPPCVNPDHLWVGTQRDNNRDMYLKGRNKSTPQIGSTNGSAKLTESDIPKIRGYVLAGLSQRKIAKLFNIDRGVVSRIVRGKSWTHVP
jgi:hypothetical protein